MLTPDTQINKLGGSCLPHGTGRKVKVLVRKDRKLKKLKRRCRLCRWSELVDKIKNENWLDFDELLQAGHDGFSWTLGRILDLNGLMPNPSRYVTMDIKQAVTDSKAGKIEYRLDRQNIIHCPIGKVSFTEEQLLDNFNVLLDAVIKAKPTGAKGTYIKTLHIASTMGPGIKVNSKQN